MSVAARLWVPWPASPPQPARGTCSIPARAGARRITVDFVSRAPPASAPVTEDEVLEVQQKWAAAIKDISSAYLGGGDFIGGDGARRGGGPGGCHASDLEPVAADQG